MTWSDLCHCGKDGGGDGAIWEAIVEAQWRNDKGLSYKSWWLCKLCMCGGGGSISGAGAVETDWRNI